MGKRDNVMGLKRASWIIPQDMMARCVEYTLNFKPLDDMQKRDKKIPKKVTKSVCPSCNRIFLFRHSEKRKGDYCDNCGQALDWSDNNG